jgi:hypothetical protein
MIKQHRTEIKRTAAAIVVFYILMLFLNGEALLRNAELMPFGSYRRCMVAFCRPFGRIASMGPGWLRAEVAEARDAYWKGVE